MAEFLLELFGEEIPARMQKQAAEDLQRLFSEQLTASNLEFTTAIAHVTPRRLALVVDGLPIQQPDMLDERKGPKLGSPEGAIQGFLKGAGLESLDQAEQRTTDKGVFWYAVTKKFGQPTADILPELVGKVITGFPWPKSMRWSAHKLSWVRPLHNILMVLNGVPIVTRLEFGPTLSYTGTYYTRGHRFLAPEPFEVDCFTAYEAKLKQRFVILDRDERKAEIARQLNSAAAKEGLELVADNGLLEEVTGLVEWPTVLIGSIDADFMDLPREMRQVTMRENQKYFTLANKDGSSAPRFAIVANVPGSDGGATIIAGNERVLRARLSDARFFWDQDLKNKLEDRLPTLEAITFHAKLGTVRDKAERISALAAYIAKDIPGADASLAQKAGLLAKADLTSGMVGEFPELQGIIGGYYARQEGLGDAIADAIAEHYRPAGPNDFCPTKPVSVAVALADKLDTLVGFFAIDELPTGSRDPYALRRAALGIIRLIQENNLRLPLLTLIDAAAKLHGKTTDTNRILAFIIDRLKVQLRDEGIGHDRVEAVNTGDDLLRIKHRADALQAFLIDSDAVQLLAAYRRAANILGIESKKDQTIYSPDFDATMLAEPSESELGAHLKIALAEAQQLTADEKYMQSMALLAGLRGPLDAFFEKVLVNDPDPKLRANRLRLLAAITETFNAIADFSKIEG